MYVVRERGNVSGMNVQTGHSDKENGTGAVWIGGAVTNGADDVVLSGK